MTVLTQFPSHSSWGNNANASLNFALLFDDFHSYAGEMSCDSAPLFEYFLADSVVNFLNTLTGDAADKFRNEAIRRGHTFDPCVLMLKKKAADDAAKKLFGGQDASQ